MSGLQLLELFSRAIDAELAAIASGESSASPDDVLHLIETFEAVDAQLDERADDAAA